jgi:hypothetical protein
MATPCHPPIKTSDENSSSSTDSDDELEIDCQLSLEQQLEQFRLQWRREIRGIGDDKGNSMETLHWKVEHGRVNCRAEKTCIQQRVRHDLIVGKT